MKGSRRKFWIITLLFFVVGGAICAWFIDDNNLLQGAKSKEEIASQLAERRQEMTIAFLVGGFVSAAISIGASTLIGRLTSRGGES